MNLQDISEKMIIQVGFNKCGTTFIEKFLNEIETIVMIQGADYEQMNNLIDYICFEEDATYDSIFAKENFYKIIKSITNSSEKKQYEIIYFQHESLTFRYSKHFSRSQMARRLKEIATNTLIVCGKRDSNQWLRSHYNQYVRSGGRLGIKEFKEVRQLRKYDDIYMSDFKLLETVLKKNLGNRLYIYDVEELRNDWINVLSRIISLSGIKANKTLELIKTTTLNKKINISDSNLSTTIKRYLNLLVPYDNGSSPYQTFKGDKIKSRGTLFFYHKFKYFYKIILNFIFK